MNPRLSLWLVIPVAVLALAVSAAPAQAQQHGDVTSWDFDRAPTATQVSLYTTFIFNDSSGTDEWQDLLLFNAEVAMPFYESLSIFGQWGVRIVDDITNLDGADDATVGIKWAFINDTVIVSTAVSGTFGFSDSLLDDGTILGGWLMFTGFISDGENFSLGVNLTAQINAIFANGSITEDFFNPHFTGEFFITATVVRVLIGVELDYIGGSIDATSWGAYMEAQFLVIMPPLFSPFIRMAFPIDSNNPFGRVEDGLFEGVFTVTVGFSLIFG